MLKIVYQLCINILLLSFIGCQTETTPTVNTPTQQAPKPKQKIDNPTQTTVETSDNVAPFLFLVGDDPIYIDENNNSFTDPGVVAQDNIDGDITSEVQTQHNIDFTTAGEYQIIYKVKDKANNSAQLTRTVIVRKKSIQTPNIVTCDNISLTVGIREKIGTPYNIIHWESNNKAVTVDHDGYIYAKEDKLGDEAKALITGISDNNEVIKCNVTIVNWRSNLSKLTIEKTSTDVYNQTGVYPSEMITKIGSDIYFTSGPSLYQSSDGFKNIKRVGSIPTSRWGSIKLIKTLHDYYLKVDDKIYKSKDLTSFTQVATTDSNSLRHAFVYDEKSGYLYAGDYTLDHNATKSIYRGKVTASGLQDWRKIFTFDSYSKNLPTSVYHIHVVTVDPYSGTIWVGTGDDDKHSRIYYSTDHGNSFKLFAIGAQHFRMLSMWFTKDYIYWNMDSDYEDQVISRIKRSDLLNKGNLTPKLTSGYTKPGVKYFIFKSTNNYFPKATGEIYIENTNRALSSDNIVIAINDPIYDYREVVAKLTNGSQWYHAWVKDNQGDDLLLMSSAAEGEKRDSLARVFGIKELPDTRVDVQELISISARKNAPMPSFVQLTPILQDSDGYIYFRGRESSDMIYKTRLTWIDQ